MSMAKYEVICEGPQGQPSYWDGVSLQKKGTIVELDPDVIKVSNESKALKPVGSSPVFHRVTKIVDGVEQVTFQETKRKPDPNEVKAAAATPAHSAHPVHATHAPAKPEPK